MNWEYIIPIALIVCVLVLVTRGNRKGRGAKAPSGAAIRALRVEGRTLSSHLTYAKWIGALDLAPRPVSYDGGKGTWYSNDHLASFLNEMKNTGTNCLLLKTAGFPIFDGAWANRYHWLVKECAKRGIYCQINVGPDFWGSNGSGTDYAEGHSQRYNWWTGDANANREYIMRVVREFREYDNVFWEVGNEMEHKPADWKAFMRLAQQQYIPAIRELDRRPIGVSEDRMWGLPVDLLELHAPSRIEQMRHKKRPWVMNEAAGGTQLWKDSAIRGSRFDEYGPIAKRCWANGASGTAAATWLDISKPINEGVRIALRSIGR